MRHGRGGSGTYNEIKAYILQRFGLNVSTLYIAQIKGKYGIKERINYNKGAKKHNVPVCPPIKEAAIKAALDYFGMI